MDSLKARITYLFHSGFAVETKDCFLVFDYYQPFLPKRRELAEGVISRELLLTKPLTYVFASHSHPDHFDPVILQWADLNTVNYILSSDIRLKQALPRCQQLSPYETYADGVLNIQTYGSTDRGVSFLVRTGDLAIFHAGDLNWWQWAEDTPQEQATAVANFKAEVGKMVGQKIDIAFFPVDRRLKRYFSSGAEYFASQLQPKLLIPMHFGNDFGATQVFAVQMRDKAVPTVVITHRGQEISF